MFNLLLNFIKNKVFTPTGTFYLVFIVIFATFLLFNTNVILSKLGVETTTNLKARLVTAQQQLQVAQSTNKVLNDRLTTLQAETSKQLKAVEELHQQEKATEKRVDVILRNKQSSTQTTITSLKKKTVTTSETIQIPIQEYDSLLAENIDTISRTYDEFFSSESA